MGIDTSYFMTDSKYFGNNIYQHQHYVNANERWQFNVLSLCE